MESHLAEKISFDKNLAQSENLAGFVEGNKLQVRIFEYYMNENYIIQTLQSSIRALQDNHRERELVELANIFSIFIHSSIDEEIKLRMVNEVLTEFPEILSIQETAKTIVELSPPTFEYQEDLMVRIYSIDEEETKLTQYRLPYSDETLALFRNLLDDRLKKCATIDGTQIEANQVLSEIYYSENAIFPYQIINLHPTAQSFDGEEIFRESNNAVQPKIDAAMKIIHEFTEDTSANILKILADPNLMVEYCKWYENILLTAASCNDSETKDNNSKVELALKNNALLKSAVKKEDLSQVLSSASGGEVTSIDVGFQGDCDYVGGTIGGNPLSDQQRGELAESITSSLGFEVNNVEIVKGKNGEELKFFDKLNFKGEVERHILCPVCNKGSIDVCDLESSCSNCELTGTFIKDTYDSGMLAKLEHEYQLRQNHASVGAFDFLSDLFDAIFGLKWI